jgi:hypothetical protein
VSAPADTSAQAREIQLAIYRQMLPGRRVALALELSQEARALTIAGIRARHPEWSDVQVAEACRKRLLGTDLARHLAPLTP